MRTLGEVRGRVATEPDNDAGGLEPKTSGLDGYRGHHWGHRDGTRRTQEGTRTLERQCNLGYTRDAEGSARAVTPAEGVRAASMLVMGPIGQACIWQQYLSSDWLLSV